MKDIRPTYRYLVLMAMAVFMAGCDETDIPVVENPVDEVVSFSGGMRKNGVVSKAGADDDGAEWLDMSYDTWMWNNGGGTEKVPVDFFIHQKTVVDGDVRTASAVYRLKSGETNRLICVDGQTPLNWQSKIATHKFRAWTKPEGVTMDPSLVSGMADMTRNNLDYEYFVGSTTGELSYAEHGLTVALKFEHLIGKLIIDNVSLIYSDGIETDNMMSNVGAIYFPNMPTTGVFNTGVDDSGDMAVTLKQDTKGIFLSLAGNTDYNEYVKNLSIPFYVLPMLFDDDNDYGEFYVNFFHPHGVSRRYKGNLKDLVNEDDPENPLSGIKAGECLTLRLVLKDDRVDGFYAYVENWKDLNPQPVKETPYPGIFTSQDLVDNLAQGNWPDFILKQNEDIIYETTADGKKIVRIFDNLDLSSYDVKDIRIIVPDGYVLDGLGHNISGIEGLQIVGDARNLYVNGIPLDQ